MLTLTVRGLERDGLVAGQAVPSLPLQVTYELTDLGRSLVAPARAFRDRAHAQIEAIKEVRERYIENAATQTAVSYRGGALRAGDSTQADGGEPTRLYGSATGNIRSLPPLTP